MGPVSTPTEIKAQAVALHALGYSCRNIERQLRAKFPGAAVPRYCTISRWVRSRPSKRLALMQWYDAAHRAAEILHERMDKLDSMSFIQLVRSYSRIMDITLSWHERYGER